MNKIVAENQLAGQPRHEWDIVDPAFYVGDTSGMDAGDPSIVGFATAISVNLGERIGFKIRTEPPTADYQIAIFRLGYYGGAGARRVATLHPATPLPQLQPEPLFDDATGLIDCGNWAESAHWDVPADGVSGIYLARLCRTDGVPGVNHMIFVVRDDAGSSALLFQTADTTWQAYNLFGDISLYRRPGHPVLRAYKVSYNRPFRTRVDNVRGIDFIKDWVFNAEYPLVRFLERNGYDVSYTTGVDTDRAGERLLRHRAFLSVGHDEYWSERQRANVEAARDAGVHLAFFSGNEVYWKTRWEPSIDATATPYRTLVCYKETRDSRKLDPLPNVWTGTWRDGRFSPPADGNRPENALTGTLFLVNNDYNLRAITVSAAFRNHRLWRNTSVERLAPTEQLILSAGTLGWEWNSDVDNGHRPAGLVRLSATTIDGVPVCHDEGTPKGFYADTATHHTTLYRHSSGAVVFSAGTINWAWGLDEHHELQRREADGSLRYPADRTLQQFTVNLLAEMDVVPATLQADLAPVEALSPPPAPPRSAMCSPAAGKALVVGTPVTITGTASVSAGVVGGVEVSLDSGRTWRRAEGGERWSYRWTPETSGLVQIRCRAVDDMGYLEAEPAALPVRIVAPAASDIVALVEEQQL